MKYKSGHAGKSVSKSQHTFSVAETGVNRERSSIDRPSRTTTAIDGGTIYPILVDEVLPGDTFQLRCQLKGWLNSPLVPFLDNIYVDTFFFFVANRLVWDNWTKFQGEKIDPGDTTTYVVPQIEIAGGSTAGANLLADYMGLPTIATTKKVNAMPFRGYNLIWNDFFRDTNLQDSLTVDKGDADSVESNYVLKKRGRRKDYLSGCLPFPQRGDPVSLPIGTTAPVVSQGTGFPLFDADDVIASPLEGQTTSANVRLTSAPTSDGNLKWNDTALEADLSSATSITVNALRQSIAIQQLLELDARGGSRHPEQLKARFGVTSADFRLQRPEYLGGGHTNVSVTPVANTTGTTFRAQGELTGYGAVDGSGGGFTHSFTEHGFVIGLVSMRTDYTYFEGIPRHWSRTTRYDYFEPMLAHLGEQAVFNQEIFVSNDDDIDFGPVNGIWGYQERFGEYKYGNSMVTSIIRPNHPVPLSQWTLAQEFLTKPTLGDTFIQEDPPIDRVVAVPAEPNLILDCYFANRTTRVMPVFNTPGLRRF